MKFKALLGAACALLSLASCQNELPAEEKLVKGEPSFAAFSIKMAKHTTKAYGDTNADYSEQIISNATIFVFSGGVLEKVAYPEVNDNVTVPVEVSTGSKKVYLLAGDGAALAVEEESTRLSDFETMLFNALESNIAEADNFVMLGSVAVNLTKLSEAEALANPFTVQVDRAAAKLQVLFSESGANAVKVAAPLVADFSNCSFTPAQCAKQMYVNRQEGMYTPLDPTGTDAYTYPGLTTVDNNLTYTASPANADPSFDANRYAGECVAERPTTGNVTFALVKVKCSPTKVYGGKTLTNNGTFWVVARNLPESATWIFAVDANYDMLYFATSSDAQNYISKNSLGSGYKAYKYDQGFCYYRLNLSNTSDDNADMPDSKKYAALRNNYYRLRVTDVKGLGAPTAPGVTPSDPTTPLEQNSFLACEVEILPWTMNESDAVLQ